MVNENLLFVHATPQSTSRRIRRGLYRKDGFVTNDHNATRPRTVCIGVIDLPGRGRCSTGDIRCAIAQLAALLTGAVKRDEATCVIAHQPGRYKCSRHIRAKLDSVVLVYSSLESGKRAVTGVVGRPRGLQWSAFSSWAIQPGWFAIRASSSPVINALSHRRSVSLRQSSGKAQNARVFS